jgi:hypothetical protein
MSKEAYSEPVQQLIRLGDDQESKWPDYLKKGLSQEDIPELIRLVQDVDLRWMVVGPEDEDPPEWFAQIHAWRALGQLKALEHLGLIEQAFQADKVDEIIMGDFEDVQVDPGLLKKRSASKRNLCSRKIERRKSDRYPNYTFK